jgi:hypothetical protein
VAPFVACVQGDLLPLHVAVLHGHAELAKYLIGRGAVTSAVSSETGTTPVMIASRQVSATPQHADHDQLHDAATLIESVCALCVVLEQRAGGCGKSGERMDERASDKR